MKKKVLIIDDDTITLKIVKSILENYGFIGIVAKDGAETLKYLDNYRDINACILDLGLPDMNGLEMLKIIRSHPRYSQIPVIILTSNHEKIETILSLEMGADDYITKPFEGRELIARLNAIFRRTDSIALKHNTLLVIGDLEIDLNKHLIKYKSKVLETSIKEYEILVLFAKNVGKVLSREVIMNKVWGLEYIVESRTIDMHVSSLRKKLRDTDGSIIETVRGVGYRLVQ